MLKYLNNKLITVEHELIEKEDIILKLVNSITENTDLVLNKEDFITKIFEREKIGSTGIGKEIVVPHARSEYLKGVVFAVAVLKQSIDFNTIDDEKVKVVLLVGAPKSANNEYLNLLSLISKSFRNNEFRKSIIEAETEDDVLETFANFFDGMN